MEIFIMIYNCYQVFKCNTKSTRNLTHYQKNYLLKNDK